MGKRPEDLPLDPDPLRHRRARADIRDEPWFHFQQEIEEMLGSGRYEWAEETLSGIASTVERYQCMTPGQRKAIDNIRAAGERSRSGSRRYEGFRGRRR